MEYLEDERALKTLLDLEVERESHVVENGATVTRQSYDLF